MNIIETMTAMEQDSIKSPIPELLNPNPLDNKPKLPHERYFQENRRFQNY
jgi:hypothetical protein